MYPLILINMIHGLTSSKRWVVFRLYMIILNDLQGQIGLNSVHMVMELIRDNRKIVDRISHEHIDTFVNLLQRDKVCVIEYR